MSRQETLRTVGLLIYQHAFMSLEAKYALLRGGIGAGKSYTICLWAIMRMVMYPGSFGYICANSYSQLSRATMTTMFRLLDDFGIRYRFNKMEQVLYLENGSYAKAQSLESPDDMRGAEAAWAIVDELAFASLYAWNVLEGRIRLKGYGPLQIRAGSTPNGFNFMYDMFAGEKKTHLHAEIHADPRLNHHLPEGYLDSLKATYDPMTYRQEVLGEYVSSTTGKKYYAFDREKHVKAFDKDQFANFLDRSAGIDFNVNPATAGTGWLINGVYYIGDEVYQENSNTFNQAKALQALGVKYGYPDAAGKSRHSSSTTTDHAILQDHGMELRVRSKNPPIKSRVNTANWLLSQGKVIIHPDCTHLIKDFETETWEKNAPEIGHVSDGTTYWMHYETPMQSPSEKPQVIHM